MFQTTLKDHEIMTSIKKDATIHGAFKRTNKIILSLNCRCGKIFANDESDLCHTSIILCDEEIAETHIPIKN